MLLDLRSMFSNPFDVIDGYTFFSTLKSLVDARMSFWKFLLFYSSVLKADVKTRNLNFDLQFNCGWT